MWEELDQLRYLNSMLKKKVEELEKERAEERGEKHRLEEEVLVLRRRIEELEKLVKEK